MTFPVSSSVNALEDYRLVFCGHSMGGAVSAMCVALLRDKAPAASSSGRLFGNFGTAVGSWVLVSLPPRVGQRQPKMPSTTDSGPRSAAWLP